MTKKRRTMDLHKVTLRRLSASQIEVAAGGTGVTGTCQLCAKGESSSGGWVVISERC